METVLITLICAVAVVQAVKIISFAVLASQKQALENSEPNDKND